MKTITPTEMNGLLASRPELLLVDVRTPAEFAAVHVPQSKNLPLDELSPRSPLLAEVHLKGQPVYLLCLGGQRAAKAAARLEEAGFRETVVVQGGTQGWLESNLPVVRGRSRVISLERQVRIAAGSLVFTGVILGWLVQPAFFGLAGFVGAGLVFAGISDFCGMGLLLARMPWNK